MTTFSQILAMFMCKILLKWTQNSVNLVLEFVLLQIGTVLRFTPASPCACFVASFCRDRTKSSHTTTFLVARGKLN